MFRIAAASLFLSISVAAQQPPALGSKRKTPQDGPAVVLFQPATLEAAKELTSRLAPLRVSVTVDKESAPYSLLVDRDGFVRRVFRDREAIPSEVKLWIDGKAVYTAQCARCHGDDGRDESYPGTRSMAGIGNRYSEEEIERRTGLAGFVDLSALTARQRRALTIFTAGL